MATAATAVSGKDINKKQRIFSVSLRLEERHVVRFGAVVSRQEYFILRIFLLSRLKLVSAMRSVPSNGAVVRPRTVVASTTGFDGITLLFMVVFLYYAVRFESRSTRCCHTECRRSVQKR